MPLQMPLQMPPQMPLQTPPATGGKEKRKSWGKLFKSSGSKSAVQSPAAQQPQYSLVVGITLWVSQCLDSQYQELRWASSRCSSSKRRLI
ncbi:hypothetical protein Trco_001389 [Trichoderma cornu-damae]|uniref:Uncharacterized protein n=1 Tax=Trichoderma cornu-damae TaxID=654480 RepID=A0A9P8QU85_9HYPO|nr:hypothetical protein Trco_001389 [Trichoderma cornu-damae]